MVRPGILASPSEGELRAAESRGSSIEPESVSGADWSWWLLGAPDFLFLEGAFAARGRSAADNTETTFVLQHAEGWLLYIAVAAVVRCAMYQGGDMAQLPQG